MKKSFTLTIKTIIFIIALFTNITLINAEQLNNQEIEQTTNLTNLNDAIDNANQLLNGQTNVFEENSFNNFEQTFNETNNFINNNENVINQDQNKVDELTNDLNTSMNNIKAHETIINNIENKIEESNQILNKDTSNYDEDDVELLKNMTNEANTFLIDYNNNGITTFLPNNKTIGQVAEEVTGEEYRLTTKIQNAIDRLNLKKLELPDLSNYDGESIAQGLTSVGEDGSYSARDILYAKVGYSDAYWGRASQNINLLDYLKGKSAELANLEEALKQAEKVNNSTKYEENSYNEFKTILNKINKYLTKWEKLGVNILPTDQEKIDKYTTELIEAINNLKIKENDKKTNETTNNQNNTKTSYTSVKVVNIISPLVIDEPQITNNNQIDSDSKKIDKKKNETITKKTNETITKKANKTNDIWLIIGILTITILTIIIIARTKD